jgi:3-dehydroquinate dehydratase
VLPHLARKEVGGAFGSVFVSPVAPFGRLTAYSYKEAINRIYRAVDEGFDGLVMNPAGFTYAGYALKDCVRGAGLLYVEIHISHILKRRIESVLSDASEGVITGFGVYGYLLALDAILHLLNQKANVPQSGERSH